MKNVKERPTRVTNHSKTLIDLIVTNREVVVKPKGTCQRAKKVVSDSLGLVDFALRLVNTVLNLPDGQVNFFGKFKLQKDGNQSC